MKSAISRLTGFALLMCLSTHAVAQEEAVTAATARTPLDFTMKNIDGENVKLEKYRGKVVLIVNVASRCGLTPQYAQIQSLYEKYGERGLAVLGFPCNDFMSQEPGDEKQIKEFCTTRYNVSFDMFSKIHVKGGDQCELYKFLTGEDTNADFAGPISWNFEKFLLDREGKVIARFGPRTKPDAPEVIAKIEEALTQG